MQNEILNTLSSIEQEQKITLLFACESGSRGWGFPSPDSDFDVRFIYARPYKFYLSVVDRRFDLNFPINGELDVYGWDIRKVLQLIKKSNTTPFEWLQSPVIYRQVDGFKDELFSLCGHYFGQRSNIHHYLGIAKGAMDTIMNDGEIKIKKLFYVLRPLLAAKWCLERKSIAPMTIDPLMNLLPAALQEQVKAQILLKAGSPESFVITIHPSLKSYIDEEYLRIDEAAKNLERDHFEADRLDEFFIKTITRYDHQ